MLEHQRRILRQLRQTLEVSGVIQRAFPRSYFPEMNVHLDVPGQIFGMTTGDPFPEFVEAFVEQLYLTKSDAEFVKTYVENRREWF